MTWVLNSFTQRYHHFWLQTKKRSLLFCCKCDSNQWM